MKTIFDAVNEFKGDWRTVDHGKIKSKYIFVSAGEGSAWPKGELVGDVINHSPTVFNELCTKDEFNALVAEMKTNFGKCSVDDVIAYRRATKEPLKTESNIYTQEMCDNGIKPSVGMKISAHTYKGAQKDRWVDAEFIGGAQSSNGGYCLLVKSSDNVIHVIDGISGIKPPTPLIDGEAYQFDYNNGASGMNDAVMRYRKNGDYFFFDNTIFKRKHCTNIKPLVVKGD